MSARGAFKTIMAVSQKLVVAHWKADFRSAIGQGSVLPRLDGCV